MRAFSFDRLTNRLVVAVGIGLLLFSTVAGVFTYQFSYRRELALAESLQRQLVEALREQAEVAVFAANARIARGVVDGLTGNPFILAAAIESKDGFRVAAGSPAARVPAARKSYPLYSPVDQGEPIGALQVQQNDAHVHSQAARIATYQTALMLAQVLLAVLILAAVLRIRIVAPIARLAKAMAAIRPGSPVRLTADDPHARDEIGLLTASANGLLDASETALKEERALRAMLETMGNIARVGGWRFDVDRRRLTWGAEIYRIFERDPAVPIATREAMAHFDGPGRREITQAFLEAVHRARSFDLELPALTTGGRSVWVRIQGQYEAGGDCRLLSGALQDITERKRAEADLVAAKQAAEAANVAKSRFLAAASHDLRQPIQAINLFQSALAMTTLGPEQKRISDSLATATRSLGDLLNALLDISRFDSGAVVAHPEALHIDALLCGLDAEFTLLATEKSLRFRLHLPSRERVIRTDPKLLHSLLGNLIGNAIKYTRRGGVLVGVRRRGDQALIQVWDTGIGIGPEHLGSIFEEYFQIGNPERNRAKGLGLGLSIARRLARLLQTEVVCRSRPGRGSVF
ncbi:partial two-component system, sensor histidine kinase, partial [Rhodocyclaceae bacterium]